MAQRDVDTSEGGQSCGLKCREDSQNISWGPINNLEHSYEESTVKLSNSKRSGKPRKTTDLDNPFFLRSRQMLQTNKSTLYFKFWCTMTLNILWKQILSRQRNGIFCSNKVSHLMSTQESNLVTNENWQQKGLESISREETHLVKSGLQSTDIFYF